MADTPADIGFDAGFEGEDLPAGAKVRVIGVDGTRLKVEKA